jgi:phospholipid transport system substrate-binding protein
MRRAILRVCRRYVLGMLAGVTLLPLTSGIAWSELSTADAEGAVNDLAVQVWRVLDRADLTEPQRIDALTALLESKTDVPLLSRLVLGRYWNQLDDQQKAQYQELFRNVVMRTFARRLDLYAKDARGRLEDHFTIASSAPAGKEDILVRSRVRPASGDALAVDWRVREGADGPVVIDLIIQGVSLLVSQRSEFASVIERSNMDGLLAELRARAGSTES